MNQETTPTPSAFDFLLDWLDSDRERAGEKYESIRRRLIKIFSCRGRQDAEELADQTIDRVMSKASAVAKEYVGDPALYFYGVAQKVYLESLRHPAYVAMPPTVEHSDEIERAHECLDRCMETLPEENREIVLEYYQFDKRAKIDHRKALADRLGIAQNALRIRACRIRAILQQCVQACLGQSQPA